MQLSQTNINKYKLTDDNIANILQPPEQYSWGVINNNWSISVEESKKNDILICILFLNSIDCEVIISGSYRFLMAGFIPIEKKSYIQSFKIDELLYMGGIKGYLKSYKSCTVEQ